MDSLTLKEMIVKVFDKNDCLILSFKGQVDVYSKEIVGRKQLGCKADIIKDWLDQNYNLNNYNLLEKTTGLNIKQADKLFRKKYKTSICRYRQNKRLECAYAAFKEGNLSIKEIAHSCGYKSISQFCRSFKKHYGITPKECKNGKRKVKKGNKWRNKDKEK